MTCIHPLMGLELTLMSDPTPPTPDSAPGGTANSAASGTAPSFGEELLADLMPEFPRSTVTHTRTIPARRKRRSGRTGSTRL